MTVRRVLLLVVGGWVIAGAGVARAAEKTELFPVPPTPTSKGYLKVGDIHEIFYVVCGNPEGKPVLVLHGGPGYGMYPRLVQYFDPQKFMVVIHDQRGAGQSRPAGEIRENTTPDLVADIERLRDHLGIKGPALVFGGSWGSTLALAYAEAHPEHVRGMVLRGVCTAAPDEVLNGYLGLPARTFFPDAVAEFEAALPAELKPFEPAAALKLFTGDDKATQMRVAEAWKILGLKTLRLEVSAEQLKKGLGDVDPVSSIRVDCYYGSNGFFLRDDQLLRDAGKLKDIPVTIINGRYDLICPPKAAWRLHQALPKSKLIIVEAAGHSEFEPGITEALLKAVAEFE